MSKVETPPPFEFLVTKEHRRFVEFCEACRRHRYIGLCYGPPGVGKTLSARRYANWDILESAFDLPDDEVPPAEILACRTAFYTPTVANTPRQIDKDIRHCRVSLSWAVDDAQWAHHDKRSGNAPPDCTELIIVDEADRLKMPGLEQLRDIYDRSHLGLILIGMPGIERRLSRYAQLYSRVGFVHAYRPLSDEELRFILARKWEQLGLTISPEDFTDDEAVAAVIRATSGNFRLIQRLFAQIERLLEINQLQIITKEVVEAARESLVIGSA